MRFIFKFLLSNGGVERHAFTASEFHFAQQAAVAYSTLAFANGELLDFMWEA